MGKFDYIYQHAPVWSQNAMVSLYGVYWHWLRFGGNYNKALINYKQQEWFAKEQWLDFTNNKLQEILSIAYKNVPYYREKWTHSVYKEAIAGDLSALPLLEKNTIRENPEQFCRLDKKPFPKLRFHTSGTTGTPILSYWTIEELRNSLALREARSANWAGVSFNLPRATFSGRIVEPNPNRDTNIYRYNAIEKQVYFSAYHLSPKTAHLYVDALRKHNITWLTGYAVSYYLLGKFILEQGIPVPSIKAVITTSEKLTPEMRNLMENAYRCKVFEEYSTVENAVFASECEQGNLHLSPDSGIVEIIQPDGTLCQPGEIGEVVTTCLMRDYQPLIRFKLGDLASWSSEPCSCGRQMPVIKEVVGRIEDIVIAPDGRQMVRFHGIFVDQPHVLEGQLIQNSLTDITVKVVPTSDFDDHDTLDIQQRVQQRLGHQISVEVELVEEIPRTKSGKFQAVVSNLDHTKIISK